ncbi:MAG: hypothetical protein HZB65_02325 [Candidatus Aenigmarchaeota archaeon]|nr:hypothetical protein [Candidatus Aenigmarchaeota archaeon]
MYSDNLTSYEESENYERNARKTMNEKSMAYLINNASKMPEIYFFTQVNIVGNYKSLKPLRSKLFWKGYTEAKLSDLKTANEIFETSEQQQNEYVWFYEGYKNKERGKWNNCDVVINPEIGDLSFIV